MMKVSAPTVHLFAFHLRNTVTPSNDRLVDEPELLWRKCDEIFEKLQIAERLNIEGYSQKDSENPPVSGSSYLYDRSKEPIGNRVSLYPGEGKMIKFQGTVQVQLPSDLEILPITGIVYPRRLYDSYALTWNICLPKNFNLNSEKRDDQTLVPISIFRQFNPDYCLLPDFIGSSLGQTILLTAWLDDEQMIEWLDEEQYQRDANDLRKIADECLAQFIPDPNKRPKFTVRGKLFGSPIFEYGDIPDAIDLLCQPRSCHIIIWLFSKKETDQKLNFCYWDLPDLFLFRNKATRLFEDTRFHAQRGEKTYLEIDTHIRKIDRVLEELPETGEISEPYLQLLKHNLKIMPRLSLTLSQVLRNLEYSSNTITIHAKNYSEILEEIRRKLEANMEYLPHTDLSFLELFNKKDCYYFQDRIKADLGYFAQGLSLVDKAIASIRGMVEIEKAQRSAKLQTTLLATAVGLGSGIVFATSYTPIAQQLTVATPVTASLAKPLSGVAVPIFYSLLFGVIVGIATYKIAPWLFQLQSKQK
ncbi:MAG: hypothetical protein ACM37W_28755 [Actinomycetota bacterium]